MDSTRYAIIGCVITLMCFGLIAVYSGGTSLYGLQRGYLTVVQRQMVWLLISVIVLFVFSGVDYHALQKYAGWILIVSFVMLVAVHLFGVRINAARRWLRFGPLSIQPAELFKLTIVLYMARFLSDRQRRIREFLHGFLPPLIITTAAFGLIVTQPDFGTAVLIAVVVGAMLVVAGVNLLHALPMCIMASPLVAYLVIVAPYRLRRVTIFLDPWSDPQNSGYHIIQSFIALGSGGLFGVGPGRGLQKNGFTPENLTDFILSIIGEEFGFLGTGVIVAAYALLFFMGMRVVGRAIDSYGSLLAFGILLTIVIQAVTNVGVVTGMLPTKGLPLPFVSAGGSSMIVMAAGIGILLNIASHVDSNEPIRLLGAERVAV